MQNAAVGAAVMSAVICGAANVLRYIQMVRSGKLSVQDATYKIIAETASSAADSAIKAAANASVFSILVRYGSKKAAIQILSRQGIKSMLKTSAVTVGVTCAIDAIKDLVLLGTGRITQDQFYERQGKGMLMTSVGVIGGSLGATGAGMLPFAGATVIGGIAGGLIAGLAMNMAIQNGIEKLYNELLLNAEALHEASVILEQVSKNIFKGQLLFTKCVHDSAVMDKYLQVKFNDIDMVGKLALEEINRI